MDKLLSDLSEAGFDRIALPSDFPVLVSKMSQEISVLLKTEESVSLPESSNPDDQSWKMELSSFLKELGCPSFLLGPDLSQRFQLLEDQLPLLDFMLNSLMSARMITLGANDQDNVVESGTAGQLSACLSTLNLSQPPPGVGPVQFFRQFIEVIERLNPQYRKVLIGQPLMTAAKLTPDHWSKLTEAAMDLEREYVMRRTMLITRLSATLQSFTWSAKRLSADVMDIVSMKEFRAKAFTNVTVADILAARKDMTILTKVSSVPPSSRFDGSKAPLTKVRIGQVPDRGGRPSEQEAPPPEMPSWQQRQGQPYHQQQRGRGGGGQRGGGHYGRGHQGGGHQGGGHQGGGHQGGGHQGGGHQGGGQQGGGGGYRRDDRNRGVQGAGWKRR